MHAIRNVNGVVCTAIVQLHPDSSQFRTLPYDAILSAKFSGRQKKVTD